MPLDFLPRDDQAHLELWFILVGQPDASELVEALHLLGPRLLGSEDGTSALILPQQMSSPGVLRLPVVDGMDLSSATHGSAFQPSVAYVLPPDRLFVLEDGVLQLRPRDMAYATTPCEHLLPSLARQYGRHLHVLVLPDAKPPEAKALSLARAFGASILTLEELRTESDPPEEAQPREPALPVAPKTPMRQTPQTQFAHELRQPLQTATLLQGLLTRQVHDPKAKELVERLGESLRQMAEFISHPGHAPVASSSTAQSESMDVEPDDMDGPLLTAAGTPATVYIIDDDDAVREALRAVLEAEGCEVRDFESCEDFLDASSSETDGCLLVDAYLPGMSGLELLNRLQQSGPTLPAIMITGNSDVQTAVRAMKAGAADFIEKPVGATELLAGVRQALALARDSGIELATREKAAHCLQTLTRRQKEIMAMVLEGHPSKIIAADLGISQRTVENHRAAIMKKTGSRSLPALARLAMALQPHLT